MKESILCGQCHGLGPNFELENPPMLTLYGAHLYTTFLKVAWKPANIVTWKRAGLAVTCRVTGPGIGQDGA